MMPSREVLVAHAQASIARGSKSFAAASRLFDRETRERVWLLYAWCRASDDLADAQDHGGPLGDQAGLTARVAAISRLTEAALSGKATGEPAFDALGLLARETGLTKAMADDVIAGFALDAAGWRPLWEADLLRYCYHVAGAVGVMMAVVMGIPPGEEETLDRACDLGLAFQLANIARDVAEDHAAGRCYLPAEWLREGGIEPGDLLMPRHRPAVGAMLGRLAQLAAGYEASARIGAARLRFRQRWAVLSAAGIYGAIGKEAGRRGSGTLDVRISTSPLAKAGFVAKALVQAVLPPPRARPPALSRKDLAAFADNRTSA